MRISHKHPPLISGVDHLSLDKRNFDLSRDDIEGICRFFAIGKLRHYEKEKGITISHSNFFFFVATNKGEYAFKFYPSDAAKTVAIEYAINRLLLKKHFLTPLMYAGHDGRSFLNSNGRLATCYSYISGSQAWQHIKQRNIFPKINAAILSLKNILSANMDRMVWHKQAALPLSAGSLVRASCAMAPYDQKKTIDAVLKNVCQTYQDHRPLFTRQLIHNNITLTNLLIHQETVYTLDLSHIREDYILSDLASLVISCLFFNVSPTTVKTIIKNYFTQHKIEQEHLPVLNTLIQIGLVKEYLTNIRREKSIGSSVYPLDIVRTYRSLLRTRKETITAVLKDMQTAHHLILQ